MLNKLRFKDKNGQDYPDWNNIKLKNILTEYNEKLPKGKELEHVSLTKEGVVPKSERYERDFLVTQNNKEYRVTHIDDICYNPANLKFGVICRNKYKDAIFSPIYVTFKVNDGYSAPFIEMLVTRDDFINYALKYQEGTVYERMSVSPKNLLSINVSIPNLEEQQKIADFLSTVDEKIENQKEIVANWEEIKKGLIQKIFSQEIRFKDENGQDYSKWHSVSLSDISLITKGQQLNKTNMMEHGDYYVLNGGIEPSGYYNKYNANENTISISEGGNSCGFVKYNRNPFWSGGHNYTLTLHDGIVPYYLYSFLKSKENQIMNLRIGGGIPNIQKSALSNFKIKITQIEEQQKIADFFSTVDKKIKYEKNILNELIELKKGLLQRIFA